MQSFEPDSVFLNDSSETAKCNPTTRNCYICTTKPSYKCL